MFLECLWIKRSPSLINAGFVVGETMEISHEDIEEGDVVRTDPKEGRDG